MNNPLITAKKKFGILLKLMKSNKFINTPPLVEHEITVNDPLKKSNIFNEFFASKSTVRIVMTQHPTLNKLMVSHYYTN